MWVYDKALAGILVGTSFASIFHPHICVLRQNSSIRTEHESVAAVSTIGVVPCHPATCTKHIADEQQTLLAMHASPEYLDLLKTSAQTGIGDCALLDRGVTITQQHSPGMFALPLVSATVLDGWAVRSVGSPRVCLHDIHNAAGFEGGLEELLRVLQLRVARQRSRSSQTS